MKYSGAYKHFLVWAVGFMIVSSVLDLLVPIYIGKCIDCIVGVNEVNFTVLTQNILIMAGIAVVNLLFTWLYNLYANIFCYKTSEHIRDLFFKKIETVPIKFVDGTTHGDLLNRMINDVEIVTDGLVEAIISISSGIFTIIGTLICMILLDVSIAIMVAVLTPISLFVSYKIAKNANDLFIKQAATTGEMSGYLEEIIGNQRVVKAFNHEEDSIEEYNAINENLTVVSEKAKFYSFLAPPLTRFINGFVYVAVGFVGALLALNGKITVGVISSFLSYANSYGRPFDELSTEITEIQAAFASARRIFAVLNEPDEISDAGNKELSYCDGNISIKNVDFSYTPKTKLIQNFNLEVKNGQKIAIVGPTGCGKTTLINLLMRFYDVTGGAIYVSGEDIRNITRGSLRTKFGMVLQESWLFHGTIRDNIAYGNQNATLEEVKEAARLSGAADFIEKLPQKYDTLVSEGGANISQGQKQLICISRIMLTKPSMLILDEATSNIDTRTEMKIQEAFNKIMEGRTSFIVAHRLSTIQNADIILVMNKGNVIEQGNHKELMKKKGFYYNLYTSQFLRMKKVSAKSK
ncbi:MAG: ABC transporter ATP-binding protein [Clostridia bacterium]|nr:ABC transporter ATP-binding protein [Clostridia bacterium]